MRIFMLGYVVALCSIMGSCSHGRPADPASEEAGSEGGIPAPHLPLSSSDETQVAKNQGDERSTLNYKLLKSNTDPLEVMQELPECDGFWNLLTVANCAYEDGLFWYPVGYARYFALERSSDTRKNTWEEIIGYSTPGTVQRTYYAASRTLEVSGYLLLGKYAPDHLLPHFSIKDLRSMLGVRARYGRCVPVANRAVPRERRWYTLRGRPPVLNGLRVSKVEITFGFDSILHFMHSAGQERPVSEYTVAEQRERGERYRELWGPTDPPSAENLFALQIYFRIEPPEDKRERRLDGQYWAVRFDNGAVVYQVSSTYTGLNIGTHVSWDRADGLDTPDVRVMTFYADYRMEPVELSYYDGETEFRARIVRKQDGRKDLRPMEWTYDGLVYKDH